MAVHPLRPATDRRLGKPLPYQLANQTRIHLFAIACSEAIFPYNAMQLYKLMRYELRFLEVVPHKKAGYPRVTHPSATKFIIFHSEELLTINSVRLACVRHAASVRPEPGSNSP